MDVSKILEILKTLLDSEKRFLLASWLFFGVIIGYLWNERIELNAKVASHETACNEILKKSQENCQEQLNLSRSKQQAQLDLFIERSNNERDSTYRAFEKKIQDMNQRVKKGLTELNQLKDESIH